MNRKIKVKIFADSRGTWLGYHLGNIPQLNIEFSVKYRKGADIVKIWEMVEYEVLQDSADIYIIFGGVCDLTRKSYDVFGRRVFWPHEDLKLIFEKLTGKMEAMARNFRLINQHAILCFLPEPGLDMVRYNQVLHPVPWYILLLQETLENNLRILQAKTQVINASIGSKTPWSLEVTHTKRGDRFVPVYDRTFDGLHFSPYQVWKLAGYIFKFVNDTLRQHNRSDDVIYYGR